MAQTVDLLSTITCVIGILLTVTDVPAMLDTIVRVSNLPGIPTEEKHVEGRKNKDPVYEA